MSRQKDREEFISIMAQEGVPLAVTRSLMRAGTTLHRLAELECSSEAADRDRVRCPARWGEKNKPCLCRDYGSGEMTTNIEGKEVYKHGRVPRIAVKEWQTRRRVERICAQYRDAKIEPVFSGDPRGAVLKIKVPSGRTNDWGQTGVCVP